jgi:hypothetical protein
MKNNMTPLIIPSNADLRKSFGLIDEDRFGASQTSFLDETFILVGSLNAFDNFIWLFVDIP